MRLCRILLAPEPESGGGSTLDDVVTISRAELDELRARAVEKAPSLDGPSDLAETWKAREAAHAREIEAREQKAGELERAYRAALRDRELATALVGKSLVPGAAVQLIKLWRDDFEVIDEGGSVQVVARDGRGVDQAVADRLAGPEFAHFCLPTSRGGTGSKGQARSSSPGPDPAAPRTLGESILQQWRETSARPRTSLLPSGWGRRR